MQTLLSPQSLGGLKARRWTPSGADHSSASKKKKKKGADAVALGEHQKWGKMPWNMESVQIVAKLLKTVFQLKMQQIRAQFVVVQLMVEVKL